MAKYYRRIVLANSKFTKSAELKSRLKSTLFHDSANPFFVFYLLIVNAYNLLRNFPLMAVNLFTLGMFI